jgi:hypothetical protein
MKAWLAAFVRFFSWLPAEEPEPLEWGAEERRDWYGL